MKHKRGDAGIYELEDASHVLQTVHRELDLCAEVMDEALDEIKQQGMYIYDKSFLASFSCK